MKKKCLFQLIGLAALMLMLSLPASALGYGGGSSGGSGGASGASGGGGGGDGFSSPTDYEVTGMDQAMEGFEQFDFEKMQEEFDQKERRRQLEMDQRRREEALDQALRDQRVADGNYNLANVVDKGNTALGWAAGFASGGATSVASDAAQGAAGGAAEAFGDYMAGNDARLVERVLKGAGKSAIQSKLPHAVNVLTDIATSIGGGSGSTPGGRVQGGYLRTVEKPNIPDYGMMDHAPRPIMTPRER